MSKLMSIHRPDDGDSKHLWNVGKLLPDYTSQRPRRQPSSNTAFQLEKDRELWMEVKAANSYLQVKWRRTNYIILLYAYSFTSNILNLRFVKNNNNDDR
jgi:hypothetical protein